MAENRGWGKQKRYSEILTPVRSKYKFDITNNITLRCFIHN